MPGDNAAPKETLPVAALSGEEIAEYKFRKRVAKDLLTPYRVAVIAENIRNGQALRVSCALAGISEATFRRYYRAGAEGDPEWVWLFEEVFKAAAEFEQEAVDAIRTAGTGGTWQAYAWLLERKYPDRYGRRTQTTVTEEKKEKVEFTLIMGDTTLNSDEPEAIEAEVVDDD